MVRPTQPSVLCDVLQCQVARETWMVHGSPRLETPPQSKLGSIPLETMTTALNVMSVPLNALRWSSLWIHGDPSCLDVRFFCLTPATQGSTRRICTEGRGCTNHHTRNRTSMICELQASKWPRSRRQHVCGEDEKAVAFGELRGVHVRRDRQNPCSLFA